MTIASHSYRCHSRCGASTPIWRLRDAFSAAHQPCVPSALRPHAPQLPIGVAFPGSIGREPFHCVTLMINVVLWLLAPPLTVATTSYGILSRGRRICRCSRMGSRRPAPSQPNSNRASESEHDYSQTIAQGSSAASDRPQHHQTDEAAQCEPSCDLSYGRRTEWSGRHHARNNSGCARSVDRQLNRSSRVASVEYCLRWLKRATGASR